MPILQINFKLNVPAAAYATGCQEVVQAIAAVPGLRWKIWILNEQEAGGLYCFDTDQAISDYLNGPIITHLRSLPIVANISAKRFEVMQDLTAITRGTVSKGAAA